MGDRLALQYGGSEAHKKVSKGAGKTKQGEFLTSIKRYYSNSFTDRVKQDAMNLFLGYFQPSLHDYALWDLETDFFLHNRLLHPPRPDVDIILLASSPLFPVYSRAGEDGDGSVGWFSVGDGRPSIEDVQEANRGEADESSATTRYFYRSTADETVVKSRIAAIERIKSRLINMKQLVLQAEEHWWRKALMDFDNERLWMKLPYPKDGMKDLLYYEAYHQPHKLTSFDEEFCHDFQFPNDATIFAAPKTEASGYWNRQRDSPQEAARRTLREDDDDDANDDGSVHRYSAVPSEFELFSFARSLGTRARNMVGDLLKQSEADNHQVYKDPSHDSTDREKVPEQPKVSSDFCYSTGSGIFENAPSLQYSAYCNIGQHPEVFIDDSFGARPSDFDYAMQPYMVDEDDVQGMETLAKDYYVNGMILAGM